jgi:hypothetical protein
MKILSLTKYTLGFTAVIFLFINWKIAILLWLLGGLIHSFLMGPNPFLNTISFFILIGAIFSIFSSVSTSLFLIAVMLLVQRFRIKGNLLNYVYYEDKEFRNSEEFKIYSKRLGTFMYIAIILIILGLIL